jgi:ElaB/YqjD/DUF883 family membrane-anchored ribosome-binding protein
MTQNIDHCGLLAAAGRLESRGTKRSGSYWPTDSQEVTMADEKIDQKRPAHAESELKKMQQRLVDDTIDDSFPASDPPAWTTTGAKSVAARCDADADDVATEALQDIRGLAKETIGRVADQASTIAQDAYRHGERLVQESRRRFPEAKRYYLAGRQAVSHRIDAFPLTTLIIAGAMGFGLAWIIRGWSMQKA